VNYSLSNTVIIGLSSNRNDTITLATVSFKKSLSRSEQSRLSNWLKNRISTDSLKLVMVN
ncbi:MAG: TIGR00341 family protein, partial [Bacteroidia bacterium]